MSDIKIRKVEVLGGRAKNQAMDKGLDEDDLVLVKTKIYEGKPPEYQITLIEGSPTEFIKKELLEESEVAE